MSLVNLNVGTINALRTLVDDPSGALPAVLKALHPVGDWELLTQKVGSNLAKAGAAELALKLLDKSASADGAISGAWTWAASVEGDAMLAIDLLVDDDLKAMPFKPDIGHTLVVYGGQVAADGKLGASADFPAWGGIAASVGGKANAALRWYVQAKNDAILLDALLSAQRHFVWPHDLQAMLRLANRTDFFGLEFERDGEAQIEINVNASKQVAGWTFSLNGEKSSVGLSFGVKAGYRAELKSRWKLSAMVEPRKDAVGQQILGLRVKLHDLKQNSRDASLALTAGADFSAVSASAERALRAAWPELDSKLLDALAQPGTAIAGHLRKLIDNKLDGSLEQLATLLVGGKPTEDLRNELVDKLSFGLADVLDGALGKLAARQASADEVVADWLDRLLGKAASVVTVDDKIKAVVSEALTKATAGLKEAIEKLKSGIVGKAQDKVDALLKTLGELGAQFDKQLDKLDDNRASQAIQEALTRYAALREKLLGALTDSHRQKVTLTLATTLSRQTGAEAVFEAWFRPDDSMTPEAERLFHSLYGGRLLAVPELLAAAERSGAVEDARGWLLATQRKLETQRAVLNFFGLEFSSSTTWLRDVSVKTDLVTGELLAAKGLSMVETAIKNRWKNRRAQLGVQLELTGGNGVPARLAASLDGAFTANQEKSDRRTVQHLLDAYADATGAMRTDVRLMMDVPSESSDPDGARRFWKQLTLAIPVALGVQDWSIFTELDTGVIERTSLAVALAQFQRRYVNDSLFSDDPVEDLRALIRDVTSVKKATDGNILEFLRLFPEAHVNRSSAATEARNVGIAANDSDGIASRGARTFLAFHRLSATVQAPLRLRNLALKAAIQVQLLPVRPDPVAVRKMLDPILAKMQTALAPVALVSETWTGIGLLGAEDEPIAWPFVSFITTMAKLAGMPVPPGFAPLAQVGESPAVLLLAPT